jgi:hypothetical protein
MAGSQCLVSECRGPYKIGVVQKIIALLQAVRLRQVWYIIGDYLVNELCFGYEVDMRTVMAPRICHLRCYCCLPLPVGTQLPSSKLSHTRWRQRTHIIWIRLQYLVAGLSHCLQFVDICHTSFLLSSDIYPKKRLGNGAQ